MTQETRLRVASNPTRGWQANKKTHLCVASGIRAMPETEKPPAMRVDIYCVPSMALILLVQVQPRVFTAKCSEPQVGISNGMDEGSGVTKFLSLRTET